MTPHPLEELWQASADHWRERGALLGYPSCCIEAFLSEYPPKRRGPWSGTGFIPCASCAAEIERTSLESFAERNIEPNRAPGFKPFPKEEFLP